MALAVLLPLLELLNQLDGMIEVKCAADQQLSKNSLCCVEMSQWKANNYHQCQSGGVATSLRCGAIHTALGPFKDQ